jgi:hypothetical protein
MIRINRDIQAEAAAAIGDAVFNGAVVATADATGATAVASGKSITGTQDPICVVSAVASTARISINRDIQTESATSIATAGKAVKQTAPQEVRTSAEDSVSIGPEKSGRARLRINRDIEAGVGKIPVPLPTAASVSTTASLVDIDDDSVCWIQEVVSRASVGINRDNQAVTTKTLQTTAKPTPVTKSKAVAKAPPKKSTKQSARARTETSLLPSVPVQSGTEGGKSVAPTQINKDHVVEEEMSQGDCTQLISSLRLITQEETRSIICHTVFGTTYGKILHISIPVQVPVQSGTVVLI